MGYISQIAGFIAFEPPLNNKDLLGIQDTEFSVLKFQIDEEQEQTDAGVLTKRSSNKIVTQFGEGKMYGVFHELESLVACLPQREFTGEFVIYGEENEDIRKLFVEDHETVTEWKIVLTWPDGSPFSVV